MSAGITDNKTLLQKADLTLNDLMTQGGYLLPAQASRFIRILTKASVLLGMVTVVPMKSHKQFVDKIRFKNRVLRPGHEATPLTQAERSKPDLGRAELDAQLFKAEVWLDNETLEDNIERGELRNTIMQLLAEAVGRDAEDIVINGDKTSTDPTLAVLDGILKQAQSHKVDNTGGSPAGPQPAAKPLFKRMLMSMPKEFVRNKRDLRFLVSTNAEIMYRDTLADRGGSLGDTMITDAAPPVRAFGIPVIDIPLFPENLGAGSDTTNALLCDPKNINVGIWRNIRIETDKDISAGVLKIVVTLRMDTKYVEEDAVVRGYNVHVG